MVDVHTPEIRSKNMRAIRSRNTKPELCLRKALYASGLRFRLSIKGLPNRPDLIIPKYQTVIFMHGCFWHGHNCKYFVLPKSRTKFWQDKIETNKTRDKTAIENLTRLGWNIVIVWECALKSSGIGEQNAALLVKNFCINQQDGAPQILVIPSLS